jgi:hypothetical protein
MPPQPPEVAAHLCARIGPEREQRSSMTAGFSLAIQAAGSEIGVSNEVTAIDTKYLLSGVDAMHL